MGLEPTNGGEPSPVFETGSSSGRMTSVMNNCGGRTRTCGLVSQSHAFLPTETTPHRRIDASSRSALRELNPPVQLGRLAPWPLGQEHTRADIVITIGSSCGDRNRTCDVTVNSRLPVPTRTPPQAPSGNRTRTSGMASRQAAVTSWAHSLLDRVFKEQTVERKGITNWDQTDLNRHRSGKNRMCCR